MISLFSKLFIPKDADLSSTTVRQKYGMLCSICGIILNLILFVFKFLAGSLSGSISITADAFNNMSDAGSSLVTLLGFKFAGTAADHEHPFGHGRIEYIAGFVVSMLIILMAIELGKSSFDKILHPENVERSLLVIIILFVSICVKLYMYTYNHRIGRKINSVSMRATATDSLSDMISTAVVLICLIIEPLLPFNIDGWCGIAVALFILYSGITAAKDTIDPLLGQPPAQEFVDRIKEIVMAHPEIYAMHDLVVHDYGPGRTMVSLHGEVPGNMDIYHLHDVIDRIEAELKAQLKCEACIHMDPIDTDNESVKAMRQSVESIVSKISNELSIHDFRMISGPSHTNLIFDLVTPPGFAVSDSALKAQVCDAVCSSLPDCNCVIKVERSYI